MMSAARHERVGEGGESSGHSASHVSIPWVVLAAALAGIGLFLISYWLTYFYWPAFGGVALVIIGAVLLFNRRTGLDHA